MKKIIFAAMAMFLASSVWAQPAVGQMATGDTLRVFFKQGKSSVDFGYKNNGEALKNFAERLRFSAEQPRSKVKSVVIVSGASPEGPAWLNQRLSDLRAKEVCDYLLSHNIVDSSKIETESRGVDWVGLQEQIMDSEHEYKNDVVELIGSDGDRVASLMDFAGGHVWRDVYKRYFPDLRSTVVMVSWGIEREKLSLCSIGTIQPAHICETRCQANLPVEIVSACSAEKKRQFRMVLKSNLLYDAMLIPNIGAEIGLWGGLALNVEYMHNVWTKYDKRDYSKKHWYRVHGGELGLKYYINRENRPFAKGHHVGLSGQMLTFDITGTLVDAEPWKGGVMATYGYLYPVTKRINLDFEVGAGCIIGDVHKYDVVKESDDVYKRIYRSTNKAAFVPKLGVTLQYLIGTNNYNERRR